MTNVCRLCAKLKSQRQLLGSIEDESLKQKLIVCCQWNSYDDTHNTINLPKKICSICLKNLNKSWEFSKKVEEVQLYLLAQTANTKSIEVYVESVDQQNEITESVKVELSSPANSFCDVDGSDEVAVEENSFGVVTDVISEIKNEFKEPLAYKNESAIDDNSHEMQELLDENRTEGDTFHNDDDSDEPNAEDIGPPIDNTNKNGEIDINRLLSESDKNADGTIKKESIVKLGLLDWSFIKCRCPCKETFENRYAWEAHCKKNNFCDTSKMLCPICDKQFFSRPSMINHAKSKHEPYLKYCCKRCYLYFWDMDAFKIHKRTPHVKQDNLVKNYMCEKCGKSFRGRDNLEKHIIRHLPIEQRVSFQCYLCKRTYKDRTSCRDHVRSHTAVTRRPHQCKVCLMDFTRHPYLKRHLMIHTGEMPFKCHCGKTFRTKFSLKIHSYTHTGEKPYVCTYPLCTFRSSDGSRLNRHRKQVHKIQKKSRRKYGPIE